MISWFTSNDDNDASQLPDIVTSKKHEKIVKLLSDNADNLTNDSLVKIVRQLDFWVKEENDLSELELIELTEKLIHISTWRNRQRDGKNSFKCPTVRFGRTELQMPIITCGAMRFQHTWMPDFIPVIGPSKKSVIKTPSQANLTEVVRQCIKMGINHFETARMYGSSEIQLCEALKTLIDNGEIKRSDFILQTKIPCGGPEKEKFEKFFNQSWDVFGDALGHIDLLSFWCVGSPEQVEWIAGNDGKDTELMTMAKEWKKDGKIKHIGFSTHGSAETIMRFIESNKFDYVNLHYHFFGSYHAEGTPDTVGGHGNLACVKRALELDMGVFNISPVDKGGQLYIPSSRVARLIGPKLSPIAFACLHSWETAKMHTVSIGFARPEDLEEALDAAEMFASIQNGTNSGDVVKSQLEGCENRLVAHAKEKLGKDWYEKGIINIPSFYDGDKYKGINGIAIGHTLWCYNMIHGYGMYETAKARYQKLENSNKWNSKKSYEENMKAMEKGNPGRSYVDGEDDLNVALSNHYDPELVLKNMKEVHELCSASKDALSDEERKKKGLETAYDLRPWNEYPDTDTIGSGLWYYVLIQNTTLGSYFYSGGGPTEDTMQRSEKLRNAILQCA